MGGVGGTLAVRWVGARRCEGAACGVKGPEECEGAVEAAVGPSVSSLCVGSGASVDHRCMHALSAAMAPQR